ncbi:MAG TPA: FAD-dependent oxidoreductase [Verrucomicrobiae bacterium]|jgi:sarcosine oxidase|nr:FAD-dependent oxidoreductase [Verrucomicrobiae bacterium]
MRKTYDFAVIGAGVFGAWTAHWLRRGNSSVALIDAYGPANSRASSSGETRVLRMGYGPDALYTRWSARSLALWLEFFARIGRDYFDPTGVLWLSNDDDSYTTRMFEVLRQANIVRVRLSAEDIRRSWPQLRFDDVTWGVLEPESGVLMARRSVQALVHEMVNHGMDYLQSAVLPPQGRNTLSEVRTTAGETFSAGTFIFACGPWLPKLFPELLADRIFPTRQEVFFLGVPAGNNDFRAPRMPVWLHHMHPDRPYAVPDIEGRGFKIAFDRHGPEFDPDNAERTMGPASIEQLRYYLKQHIPDLENAPVVESRVCQYENTWNGDFLLDRHPELENVWIAGGGSGHGFKHGPAVGEYLTARILHGAEAEPRFSLASKQTIRNREIY